MESIVKYIEEGIKTFETNENLILVETAIAELVDEFPQNKDPKAVLLKVSTLNTFNFTQIKSVVKLARFIAEIPSLDVRLEAGDATLIPTIAQAHTIRVKATGEKANFYSFATKYCAMHQPDKFAIYDDFVAKSLHDLNQQWQFSTFEWEALLDYQVFSRVMQEFHAFCEQRFSYTELDRFLWQHSFPAKF